MNALKKSSELWHTSVNRKARPVVEGEHNKSWNDRGIKPCHPLNGDDVCLPVICSAPVLK